MNPFEMVLGIILILAIAKMYSYYTNYKSQTVRHMKEFESKFKTEDGANQAKSIDELEKRVQVLESIIVDKEYHLERKIAGL